MCSIVRDAEKGLKHNIPVIDRICKAFSDYKIVVFENDSIDDTKALLQKWMDASPEKVYAYMSDRDATPTIPAHSKAEANPFFSRKRIGRMAALRNQYMNLIWDKQWQADYLMVVDLDVAGIDYEGVMSSFKSEREWDAVTAFGHSMGTTLHSRYHDTYALTLFGDDSVQTETRISELRNQLASFGNGHQWIRVESAFGGLAIYRMEAVQGIHYEVMENNDSRVEVLCEHYSIFYQMRERGFDRFYINPEMKVKYQELNYKTVKDYIQHKIGKVKSKIAPPSRIIVISTNHCIGGDAVLKAA